MTDKKYTLTEGQLADLYNSAPHRTFYRWLAHLTPDPSPSGDVVEAGKDFDRWWEKQKYRGLEYRGVKAAREAWFESRSRLAPIVEAEVQRRIKERLGPIIEPKPVIMTPKGAKHE